MPNGSAGSLVAIQASRSVSPYSGTSGQTEIHLHTLGHLRTWYVSNQNEMRTPAKLLLLAAFLVGSYYVRPAYDLIVVVAGRATDAVVNKTGTQLAQRDRQGVVDRVIQQGDEITAYALTLRGSNKGSATYRALDFSSRDAYNQSSAALRRKFGKSLRYPPPGFKSTSTVSVKETVIGSDEVGTYHELEIPVLPGVHAVGLYMRPLSAKPGDRLPLVVAAHGREGMPAPTADHKLPILTRSNRDLAYNALRHGYAVWSPVFVHYGRDGGNDFRDRLTVQTWKSGTSLPAIEIAKVVKAIDYFSSRTDIDANRIAMVGISYGGFYTLYTAALDLRIRVAVIAAYFNDREQVLDSSEPYGKLDWRYPDSLSLWRDPDVVALVAPRALLIQAGNQDQLFPIDGARRTAPYAANIYSRLGAGNRFEFMEFIGRHDFAGSQAMKFIDKQLAPPK